jgi:RimJ/RimL family protein N-acetyltransferase
MEGRICMQLETERLLLREPQAIDFDRYWQMVTDPVAKKYTGGVTRLTRDQRREQFLQDCRLATESSLPEFSVVDKSNQRYIGYCGFRHSPEWDAPELIFGYCRDAWGQGFGQEAAQAVMKHGFCCLGLDTVIATTHRHNVASAKILIRIGMLKVDQISAEKASAPAGPDKAMHTDPIDHYHLSADRYFRENRCR